MLTVVVMIKTSKRYGLEVSGYCAVISSSSLATIADNGVVGLPISFESALLSSKEYEKMDAEDYNKLEVRQSLLKDYAVCSCIYFGNNRDSLFQKDNSFSVLVEISQFDPKVISKIDNFAELYSKQIQEGTGDNAGARPVLFRCLSLYKTVKLDSLIRAVTK